MHTIEVQIGKRLFSDLEKAFDELADSMVDAVVGASRPVSQALRTALQRVAKKIEREHSAPWNGKVRNPTKFLQSRSGDSLAALKASIRVTGSGSLEALAGHISTGFWSIHETGGTIRAKRAKYLTIPLPPAMDSRGIPLRKSARDWDNTFVAKSKRGNLLIFQKRGRDIVPLYLLKESVYIPPRLKMGETIENEAIPYFERRAFDILERAILRSME